MRYLKLAVGIVLLGLVPLMLIVQAADAQRFTSRTARNETVNGTVFSSGRNVELRGTINGDVFCMGGNLVVDAVVNGDVVCAGQNITVHGRVNGDVRVAGRKVELFADISRSATVAAWDFAIRPGARVGRDLVVSSPTQTIRGEVARDYVARGNTITLGSVVGRNANIDSGTLRLTNDALIAENLTFPAKGKLEADRDAEVQGRTMRDGNRKRDGALLAGMGLIMYLFVLAGLLLVGLALAILFPQVLRTTGDAIKRNLGMALLVGLLASLIVPLIIVALMLSLVGIPLAVACIIAWLLLIVLSGPVAAYSLGRLVLRGKTRSQPLAVLVGAAILTTIYIIPILGVLILIAACWVGLGGLLLTLKGHIRPRLPESKEAPKPEAPPSPAP